MMTQEYSQLRQVARFACRNRLLGGTPFGLDDVTATQRVREAAETLANRDPEAVASLAVASLQPMPRATNKGHNSQAALLTLSVA
jgi:hypothetical protein